MNFFDLHCDTVVEMYEKKEGIKNNSLCVNLVKGEIFNDWTQVLAVFVPDNHYITKTGFEFFKSRVSYLKEEIEKNPDAIELATSCDDYKNIKQQGKAVGILSMESATGLDGNLDNLLLAKEMGLAMMSLTWNGENQTGYGTSVDKGLKIFGRELLREMEKLNIILDVSHTNDVGLDEILRITNAPVVASHSNSRSVYNNKRNIKDEHFKEIVNRNGLVGINFYKHFLNGEKSDFKDIKNHIDHFLLLGGENTVAIGSDFDGADINNDINSIEKTKNLYEFLVKNGYGKKLTDKIFYENADNFFMKNL